MAKIIAIAGEKGGTGKTTVAHLVAHGAGSLPHPIQTVVITTDPNDQPVTGERRYLPVDGRDLSKLSDTLARLDKNDRLLIVIDGAAARPQLDQIVKEVSDLVVLPYGPSVQEARRTAADLDRLPEAFALPNRWPSHPAVQQQATEYLQLIPDARRLPHLVAQSRVHALLDPAGYARVATPLSAMSQKLALELLYRMKVHPLDLAVR